MKKEEIVMGLAVSVLCIGASSFVAQSRSLSPSFYQQAYSTQSDLPAVDTIETLPDGNYRFCSESASGDGSESGMCFRFQKMGDRIIGNYQPANSPQASLCLAGRVNRNIINGEAIDFSSPTAEPLQLRPELQGGNLVNWNSAGSTRYLKVASGQAIEPKHLAQAHSQPVGSIRFRQASLDLSSFHQYSTGAIEPPANCDAG